MMTQEELYRLGFSLEITTLILSQADWGVLAQSIQMMCAWLARVRGVGLYRVRPAPSLPSNDLLITKLMTAVITMRNVPPLWLIKQG